VGKVEEDSMIYYIYNSNCEDCTLFISASSYSIDADIDMYINFGHKKELPTKDLYDIKSDSWFSEHVELDLQHEYMRQKKIKSMNEVIIIGVYAKEATTISIEIEETSTAVKRLKHGKGVMVEQEESNHKFFQYKHTGDVSLKFELTGLTGNVNMRINCFVGHENDEPEHKYLPTDVRTSKWNTNSIQNATIMISDEDDMF
jgi:hypothetical protein